MSSKSSVKSSIGLQESAIENVQIKRMQTAIQYSLKERLAKAGVGVKEEKIENTMQYSVKEYLKQ
jgi:hypothetical protein